MRPIKFRVWDRFQMDYEPQDSHGPDGCVDVNAWLERAGQNGWLMQFTGLLDKNGKEIWEGDIAKIQRPDVGEIIGVWAWDESQARFVVDDMNPNDMNRNDLPMVDLGEVIGNIYENPNLISQ